MAYILKYSMGNSEALKLKQRGENGFTKFGEVLEGARGKCDYVFDS